jgi:hypothetical protein
MNYYTAVVNLEKKTVFVYGDGNYHSADSQSDKDKDFAFSHYDDMIIRNANVVNSNGEVTIKGELREYKFLSSTLSLTEAQFATSRLRRSRFKLVQVLRRKINSTFPFLHSWKESRYNVEAGWISFEKHERVSIDIPQAIVVKYAEHK